MPEVEFHSMYLMFQRDYTREKNRKTKFWLVYSKTTQAILGEISWYSQWRQYTFRPKGHTIWNDQCLLEISDFLRHQNAEHKATGRHK